MIWRNQEINIHSSINDVFICHIMLNFCANYLEFRRERNKTLLLYFYWTEVGYSLDWEGLLRVFFLLIDFRELTDWTCLTSLLLETYVEHRNLIRKCYKTWGDFMAKEHASNIDLCHQQATCIPGERNHKPIFPSWKARKSIQKVSNMHQAT